MPEYRYNGHPIITPVEVTNHKTVYKAQSFSSRQLRTNPNIGHLWGLSFDVIVAGNPVGNQAASELFMDIVKERTETNTMPFPQFPEVDNFEPDETGALPIAAAASSGTLTVSINTSGMSVNDTLLPKGCFIQFSNHNKIYAVGETLKLLAADISSGSASLEIYPNLIKNITTSETINTPYSPTKPIYHYWRNTSSLSGLIWQDSKIASPGKTRLIEAI